MSEIPERIVKEMSGQIHEIFFKRTHGAMLLGRMPKRILFWKIPRVIH